MTLRYVGDEGPTEPKPFTDAELDAGFRRLSDGFPPGSRCDPTHDGDMHYGSSYEYNPDGSRVYKPDRRRL